jgi:hypothetical protein
MTHMTSRIRSLMDGRNCHHCDKVSTTIRGIAMFIVNVITIVVMIVSRHWVEEESPMSSRDGRASTLPWGGERLYVSLQV